MKVLKSFVLGSVGLLVTAFVSNAQAATGDCAKETSERVSEKCRLELARSMMRDRSSRALRRALEASYPLKKCRAQTPGQQKIVFVNDDAVGPILEVSTIFVCTSKDDGDGYTLTGEYFLDGGGYRFKQIELLTAE